MDEGVADTVSNVLTGVIKSGTAQGLGIDRPAAGKTGTVTDYADAWFIGYTPQLAGGVFIGHPLGARDHKLRNVSIGGHKWSRVFGATIPGPIWQQAMKGALKGVKVKNFPPPDASLFRGKPVPVPTVAGLSVSVAEKAISDAGLTPRIEHEAVAFGGKPGTVAFTSPAAGTPLPIGSTVTIYVTNGQTALPSASPSPGVQPGPGFTPSPEPTRTPRRTKGPKPH
jgi:membrane peptidoglycan carboxypeptidase